MNRLSLSSRSVDPRFDRRPSQTPSLRPRLKAVFFAVLAALLAGSCDPAVGPESTEPDPEAALPDSASVSFSPMPTGTSLPDPGEAGPGAGIVRPGEDEDTGGGGPATQAENEAAAASPYGCYLASRPYSEAVRFRSVYLRFPRKLVEAAGDETERFTYELRAVREAQPDTADVRYAHCIIPEAEGARTITRTQIVEAGKKDAALAATKEAASETSAARAESVGGATTSDDCGTVVFIKRVCTWADCTKQIQIISPSDCGGGSGGGGSESGGGDSGDSGGGGGTGGEAGDSGNGGDNAFPGDSGGSGGGGGSETCTKINPEPGSDCAPPEPAPKEIPQIQDFNPAVDTVKIGNLPDCDDPQGASKLDDSDIKPDAWGDYCESSLPNAKQEQRIEDAIDRIEKRGDMCAQIANRARSYLEKNLIYFDPKPQRAGGHGYEGLVIIWEDYVDRYHSGRTKKDDGWAREGSLQSILVHEFDHAMGEKGHLNGTYRTSHQKQGCVPKIV